MPVDPLTIGLIGSAVSGLVSGLFAGQESPQEKAYGRIQQTLEESEEYFKSTPFSKDEIMKGLLPQVQKIFRGSADVLAGKLGARTGEAGIAGGQASMDYYIQSIAPVIARGEELAGGAVLQFSNFWATLDAQAKNRFLESVKTQLGAAAGLPTETAGQRGVVGFLQGADIFSTGFGNIQSASALTKQGDSIENFLKSLSGSDTTQRTSRDMTSRVVQPSADPTTETISPL